MNSDRAHETEWLRLFLKRYYYFPALAFWRALEARALGAEEIKGPSLDIGAYDGSFTSTWLLDRPPIDVGVDLKIIKTADTDRAYRHVVFGDGELLPFADRTFNTVLCNSVIEHTTNDERMIGEIARLLKPGGVAMITAPSVYLHDMLYGVRKARASGDEKAAQRYMEKTDKRILHVRYRSVADWMQRLSDVGLRVVFHRYYISPSAAAYWDKLDTWTMEASFLGRRSWEWIRHSRKLHLLLPPQIWYKFFYRMLEPRYLKSIEVESRKGMYGAAVYLRAVRED